MVELLQVPVGSGAVHWELGVETCMVSRLDYVPPRVAQDTIYRSGCRVQV